MKVWRRPGCIAQRPKGKVVQLFDVGVAEEHVAGKVVSFSVPQQPASAARPNARGCINQVGVSRDHAIRVAGACSHVDEIADVLVAKASEVGCARAAIHRAEKDSRVYQVIGQRLEMTESEIEIASDAIRSLDELSRPAEVRGNFHGEFAVVIVREAHEGDPDLAQLADALRPAGAGPDAFDGRKKQRGEDRNDGDHDQKLDQRETVAPAPHSWHLSMENA